MSKDFTAITQAILQFRDERNWQQFHTIKDLLLGLQMETAELAELVLWKSEAEISQTSQLQKPEIAAEIADIFIFLTYISQHFEVDLLAAVEHKLQLNALKYPIAKSWNCNKKYTEFKDEDAS